MDKRFESVLRMKDGLGDSSYARNSTLQGNALECIEHDLEETIWRTAIHGCPTIRVADLGSSSGHNAVNAAKTIIKAFKSKVLSSHGSIPMPELQIFFNDLPSNDFNTLFNIISDDRSEENIVKGSGIFVGGIPGSFYRRLFPANSLHFVFSAFALQWLSQVPEGVTDKKCIAWNGGNVHVSNPAVAEAYSQQFQTDFAHFLSLRGPEVVSGGRMFLIFAGRESIDPTQQGRGEIIAKLIQLAFSDIIFQKGKEKASKNGKKEEDKTSTSSDSQHEGEYRKGVFKTVLWLIPEFPLETEELIPFLDTLANTVKLFGD